MEEPGTRATRVLVVEDHPMVRDGLIAALRAEPGLAADQAVGTLRAAREALTASAYDVVLLDHQLPDGLGAQAVPELLALSPGSAVVMLTASGPDRVLADAVAGGAAGLVAKSDGVEATVLAVHAAARGEAVASPERLRRLLTRGSGDAEPHPDGLAAADRELLALLAGGATLEEAAGGLGLAAVQARGRVAAVASALGGRSTLETLLIAVRAGLLPPPRR